MEFWTVTHARTLLPSLAVMLVLAWALRRLLSGKEERVRIIPLQVVASLIAVLEIVKQVRSMIVGYDLYHLPLHVCSLIAVLLPVVAFYRGRYKEGLRAVTVALSTGLFALMMIAPNAIYSDESIQSAFRDFGDFHTTAFHTLAIFALVLLFALELYKPQLRRHARLALVFTSAYCVIAAVLANLLQTNFNNFYRCVLEPAEQARIAFCTAHGQIAGQVLYAFLVSLVNIGGILVAYTLYALLCRALQRNAKQ
ncbi:MAG: YwaF family protein [Clostridia bacterium]|nr:YwaF family protein [Clostridia bacterium]